MKSYFILQNINISDIDTKYQLTFKSNIDDTHHKQNTTCIDELSTKNDVQYSFFDNSKKNKKCTISMIDQINKPLPTKTNILCHWCKHKFNYSPIGCPISYQSQPKSHFIVDGIFCSFNCCLAYINENKHNSLYDNSINLLYNMYKIYNKDTHSINQAPHWKLLSCFSGNKSIEEFRNHFNTHSYTNIDNYITSLPKQLPIAWLYEEKIKF